MLSIIGLISCSCGNQKTSVNDKNTNNQIVLSRVNNEHPNKKSMEWFLNNYKEEFIEQKEDLGVLENQDLIQTKYCFQTKSNSVTLFLIFCNNWKDAQIVGETNFSSVENNQNFGTNGTVLFVVKGNDKHIVGDVLSHFAGKE
ncbi:MAG: hypothetical protein KKA07_01750 [Bacteroidetes bacterium]|nr:hypothetical protein [Bacteroidota bacterium]MBU1717774.1 hypothetical protein [Bacteroidota bacterium]